MRLTRRARGPVLTGRQARGAGREEGAPLQDDVERRDAVRLGERREVEDVVDEAVDLVAVDQRLLAEVDQLGRPLAGDLDPEQLAAARVGDELQEPLLHRRDLPARELAELGAADEAAAVALL